MDTLIFDEKNYTKIMEAILNVSIIVGILWCQSFAQIHAVEDKLANLTNTPLQIDTLQIKDAIMTEFSPEYQKKKFDEKINNKYPKALIYDVSDGVKHIKLTKYYNGRPVRINVIEINSKIARDLEVKPALSNAKKMQSRKTITTIAKQENAVAAINGTFFKPQTGVPLGTLMIEGEIYTGPIYDRVAMGFFDSKSSTPFDIARVQLDATVKGSGTTIKIDNINQPRMLSTYNLVYTSKWGKYSPYAPVYGVNLLVQNGVITKASANPIAISGDDYVISGPKSVLNVLLKDKDAKLTVNTNPQWKNVKHIVSGGPYLVKNGEVFVDMSAQKLGSIGGRNPRSAIGYTKDNDFIIVAADGREGSSIGLTLNELAQFMKSIGCTNAMNLDGGGSTVMYVNGKIVNKPAVTGGIPLSNALILTKKT